MTYARQFPLPFPLEQRYEPDAFLPGACNEAALAWMARPAAWPLLRLAVYGDLGAGKTHLLHWFAARHGAALLPATALRADAPPPDAPALAVDDADSVLDPTALLHLINAAAERATPLVLTGRAAPAHWPFTLPDLMSRLRATNAVALLPPEDDLLRALFARLLAERQISVPERIQDFVRLRLPRTGAALREAAARLDHAALSHGGAVTFSLASRVLESLAE